MKNKRSILAYGVISYFVFIATFLYSIGFIGNFFVPKTIDGEPVIPFMQALVTNLVLLSIFAVQHSVMARPAFKVLWTKIIPQAAERSTYVLLSSVALIVVYLFWQPLGGSIWTIENAVVQSLLYGLYGAGWLLVLASTFLINHFDLFGLRQVWLNYKGVEYIPLEFKIVGAYKIVRHPLYVGWFIVFWATPFMTVTHLFFAVITTVYILVAVRFEEHDLCTFHKEYAEYQKDVPRFIPHINKHGSEHKPHSV